MYIDTHAHLDFDSYNDDREKVIQRALENQVTAIITIGVDVASSRQAVLLAEKYAPVFAAVGIHPNDCALAGENDFKTIAELAKHEKVVAIGEVGLDYYRDYVDHQTQQKVFREQIALAKSLKMPLIIHNRDAHEDLYELLINEKAGQVGGVLHAFSGDPLYLEKILNTSFFVSFTGNITFKKSTTSELVSLIPLDRMLLETDSPFLAPVPMRGKRNEPAYIKYSAEKIAEIKKTSLDEVSRITTDNASKLFHLDI